MKKLLWFSRDEKPIIELVLSAESAQWIADHIPPEDRAHQELMDEVRRASDVSE